jgi:hypothetical protein
MDKREALFRRCFDACNAADYGTLVCYVATDGVHYFPPGLPGAAWRGVDAIARGWIWRVETLGSRWTIERALCGPEDGGSEGVPEAMIEWTHWKSKANAASRGDEWYRFDSKSGLIVDDSPLLRRRGAAASASQ